MHGILGRLASGMAAALLATGALAQEIRGKRAGDLVVGLGAIGVLPANSGGSVDTIGGRVHASNSASPQLPPST